MRSTTPRLLPRLALGLAAVVVGVFLLLSALYRYGLSLVPESARFTAFSAPPPLVEAAIWARFGGSGPPELRRMTPWSFTGLRLCRLFAGRFWNSEGREACLRYHPGISVASATSHEHLAALGPLSALRRDLGEAATAAWLTRSRSAPEVLADLAGSADWGHGWHGVDEAAEGFFAKPAKELTAPEAALLAAALTDRENHSRAVDPWCAPAEARRVRDHVLEQMAGNGALSASELASSSASSLGVVDRGCSARGG